VGIGDWGLGIAQSPIPNPQSPIPNPLYYLVIKLINLLRKTTIIIITKLII